MKLYLAGPMRGYPNFNFAAFEKAAAELRAAGHLVFSPHERDIQRHNGVNIGANNPTGSEAQAEKEHGFSLQDALSDDTQFIIHEAQGIALLPGWSRSSGALAEKALSDAFGTRTAIYMWDAERAPQLPKVGTVPPMPRPSSNGRLPTGAADRKEIPLGTGCIDYFPDALIGVARVSFKGNKQHNPGQPLHWAKEKSTDHADTMQRHYVERFKVDNDGEDHAAKMCWRALAFYQTLIEENRAAAERNEMHIQDLLEKNGT